MNNAIFAYETHKPSLDANLSEFDSARLFSRETLEFFKEMDGVESVFLDDAFALIACDGATYFREGPDGHTTIMIGFEDRIIAKGNNIMEAVTVIENHIKNIKS